MINPRQLAVRAAARAWKQVRGRAQWRLLWLRHPTFMIGVTGAVFDDDGRVLLLRHRFWAGCQWGPPSGYMVRGETFEQALARETAEETGQQLTDIRVRFVRSGFRLRIEAYLSARLVPSGPLRLEEAEILEARFFEVDELPAALRRIHRELIEQVHAEHLSRGR
ncbi:NUDIX domain-containing protein [Microlunatus speluncae]|uniref:NUDIX domain-containing protein n=1 Tax=Microlunatus speluncae TaxID=2594267 RepID=UPI0012667629|nr:NUDIX domain-containing protein [Microlunatus speluncae]